MPPVDSTQVQVAKRPSPEDGPVEKAHPVAAPDVAIAARTKKAAFGP